MKARLKTGEEKELSKGVHMDKELNATIRLELKSKMVSRDYTTTSSYSPPQRFPIEIVISLDELDNTDNQENERLSHVLFRYHVTDSKEFTSFKSATPQYKRLKNWGLNSLNLRMTDQNDNIMTEGPGMIIVLHLRE